MFKLAMIGGSIDSIAGYPHLISSQMDNNFKVTTAVFSTNEQINKETSIKYGVENIYNDWQSMLENEKNNIDAVVILVPTNMHCEVICKVLEYNLPIICEKPVTGGIEDIYKIEKIYDEKKHFLAVVNNYTGYPMLREIKERIKLNYFGDILTMRLSMPQESFLRPPKSVKYPQKWRLKDNYIPMISLDLGSHLHNIGSFLLNKEPKEVLSKHNSFSSYEVVDDVNMFLKYENEIFANFWFSKIALGNRNGLAVEIYGSKASVVWEQEIPEKLIFSYSNGEKKIVDRGSEININNKLYNRMTPGHPAGFIEAFANIYNDIYIALDKFKKGLDYKSEYLFSFNEAKEGIKLLHNASKSNEFTRWIENN